MPVTISAKKKLRQDKKRQRQNSIVKKAIKEAIKTFKAKPSLQHLAKLFSLLDSAGKKKIFHVNKVARQKSKFSKLLSKKSTTSISKPKKVSAVRSQALLQSKKTIYVS
ncbi:30S ribosomal protein S20 [Candidatus Gottesmanbacteria bacterium]|nr:30S ribosomal protein S20 [Candidatus Gottesmanbacteria bacterium]